MKVADPTGVLFALLVHSRCDIELAHDLEDVAERVQGAREALCVPCFTAEGNGRLGEGPRRLQLALPPGEKGRHVCGPRAGRGRCVRRAEQRLLEPPPPFRVVTAVVPEELERSGEPERRLEA